jgi:hypothetical protein
VVGDQLAQHGAGVLGVAEVPGAVECVAGPWWPARGRSRCRAATRRLPADRRHRREQAPGCGPGRPRLGCVPTGGGGIAGGVPGRAVRPRKLSCSCCKARQPRQDVHGRGMPPADVLFSVGSP